MIHRVFYMLAVVGVMLWFTSACTTTEKAGVEVQALDSAKATAMQDGLIYGLPKTQLTFTIQAVRTERIPGPYHEYGEKLLGLSGIPHEQEVTWSISGIDIRSSGKLDYQHLYVVRPSGKVRLDWNKLTSQGWIIPFDGEISGRQQTNFYPQTGPDRQVLFDDLSVKRFVGKETRTVYEKVWRDSIYARVPVEKTETIKKSPGEKAQEAAGFIFMIREKRFELISGMGDYYPEGHAMQSALDEMNRLEQKYLSLFQGKTFTDTLNYTVKMTPGIDHLSEPVMLFRYSPQRGIFEADDNKGAPVWLDIQLADNPEEIKKSISREIAGDAANRFYYRLPMEASVELRYGDQMMANKFVDFSQYGPILQMPMEFVNRSRFIHYPLAQ